MVAGACIDTGWGSIASSIENTIIAFSVRGSAIESFSTGAAPVLTCCDLFGNEGGDWTGRIADQYGINGNISADPLLCDPKAGDLTLREDSPCAPFSPPNPECGLIGACPVGCAPTPAVETTWGAIKALFLPARAASPQTARPGDVISGSRLAGVLARLRR